jgi:hypothetical protein
MLDALFATLQEEEPHEWTAEDLREFKSEKEFTSERMIAIFKEHKQPGGGAMQSNDGGGNMIIQPTPLVDTTARDIINLTKMITAENKYSGQNDHFDTKLTIFNEYCS